MKRLITTLSMLALMAVPALATHFVSFDATADCDGFETLATIQFSSGSPLFTMEYLVTVTDADGTEVTSVGETLPIECWGGTCDFVFTGVFEPALEGGPFTVAGTFTIVDAWGTPSTSFETTVTCGEPPSGWCPRTPGYWKNHPENWPVATLTVGGVELSQAEALDIFDAPVRGDATVILAKHLMAAMLNMAMGAEDMVGDTIGDANAFLMDHPVFSRPSGATKQEALGDKDILANWNETECDEDDDMNKSAATEEASWSTIKGLFE